MGIWVPGKPMENSKQNTVNGGSCCGCCKCVLMGQCRELGIVEVFFFLASLHWLLPVLLPYGSSFVLNTTQIFLSVSPGRQTWDGCPFLALTVLDPELDFKTYSNTVWTKCSDSYFVCNYKRVFNIIVVIFECFLKISILFTLSCFVTGTESPFVTTGWLQW